MSYSTAKIGVAVGIFCLVISLADRLLARWTYRTVRGSIVYWQDELRDLKNGGSDSEQAGLVEDEFVNDAEGWESPVIKKSHITSRHVKWEALD